MLQPMMNSGVDRESTLEVLKFSDDLPSGADDLADDPVDLSTLTS